VQSEVWKRHEANLDDQMKSLKAQLNSAQEQLELGRATESHWRSKHSALESQLEDLKADMHRLQLGVKEKEQLLVSAFERRQFQLEADLKTSEAKLNSLQKVKMVQDGELHELRASNSELKQRDHLTKAVYEKNLLSLEEELKRKETAIQSLLHIKDIQETKLKELHDDHDNIYRKHQQELKEVKDFYEKRVTSLEVELREESSASQRLQITNSALQKRMEELVSSLFFVFFFLLNDGDQSYSMLIHL
jgi:chromosome segregation ATPase